MSATKQQYDRLEYPIGSAAEILTLYKMDACFAEITLYLLHRVINEMQAIVGDERLVLILTPHRDAILRCQLMKFTREQLDTKNSFIVNPLDRVSEIIVTNSIPQDEIRVKCESGQGFALISNLNVAIPANNVSNDTRDPAAHRGVRERLGLGQVRV